MEQRGVKGGFGLAAGDLVVDGSIQRPHGFGQVAIAFGEQLLSGDILSNKPNVVRIIRVGPGSGRGSCRQDGVEGGEAKLRGFVFVGDDLLCPLLGAADLDVLFP